MKPKALILTTWYPPPHAEYIKDQAEAISQFYDVHVIYVKFGVVRSIKRAKEGVLTVHRLSIPYLPKKTAFLMQRWIDRASDFVLEVHQKERFQIVHAHAYLAGFVASKVSEKTCIPHIITLHNTNLLDYNYNVVVDKYLKMTLPRAEYVICVGKLLQRSVMARYKIDNTVLIPNMVDTERFHITKESSVLPFKFVVIGSLDRRKRLFEILEAMKSLDEKVELHIVGKIIHPKTINDRERIKLYGQVNNNRIPEILSRCDCLISFSTQETFGITVIEAMSCGLPVLYTPSGGPEYIVPEWAGVCVQPTIEDLSMGMREAMKIAFDKEKIRTHVLNNYSVSVVTQKINDLYKKCLAD